jgi:hypothetical protein
MKHFKILGLAFIAMLSLTGILAATANAAATLPSLLPKATGEEHVLSSFTSKKSTFAGGFELIKSEKDEGTILGNSLKLGSFDLLFLETTNALGTSCTGLNDTISGSVLVLGTYHIRDYNLNGTLRTAAIFLLLPVHFECGALVNAFVSGCVAGALTPENTKTKTLTATLTKNGEDNAIITVLNEENTGTELCQLLSKNLSAATKLSSEETTETISNFQGTPVTNGEVEVMRL